MSVMIQELTTSHYAACERLLKVCQDDFPSILCLDDFISIGGQLIGAVQTDSVIALLVWMPSFDSAYLALLVVDPKVRRHGLGKQLMQFWIEKMRANSVDSLGLDVPVHQSAAIHLYQLFGFEEQDRLPNYYSYSEKLQVDALKMQKIF